MWKVVCAVGFASLSILQLCVLRL